MLPAMRVLLERTAFDDDQSHGAFEWAAGTACWSFGDFTEVRLLYRKNTVPFVIDTARIF